MTMRQGPLEFDLNLIWRLDRSGPRYTSYPTADRFTESFCHTDYEAAARRRNTGGVRRPLSLYVHLPFCATLCHYCACNKIATRDRAKGRQYLGYLEREIGMQAQLLTDDLRVTQMHWGGGTPTFHSDAELARLNETLRGAFDFAPDGDYSIEIDPRTVDAQRMAALRTMGFNRVSLGVQDFDPDVQKAVHRLQDEEQTLAVIAAARANRFASVNVDLIYGLPRQNLITFNRTLARVISAAPDRIAIYNYAHLPHRFAPQRRIKEAELPAPEMKLKLLDLAVRRLTAAGYVYIGMDHFALPGDALACAQAAGRLTRNFQGYSTHAECDLVGLGVSAIGQMGPAYSQNHRALLPYFDGIDQGRLPVTRGIELSADDLVRRSVIQRLTCDFALNKDTLEMAYAIDFDAYFADELQELEALAQAGLVTLDGRWISVTPRGRMLVRNVCMVFDRYLRHAHTPQQFSRVI
jgi:oxygen-independent coproporphyrinogen-3 oxidase